MSTRNLIFVIVITGVLGALAAWAFVSERHIVPPPKKSIFDAGACRCEPGDPLCSCL